MKGKDRPKSRPVSDWEMEMGLKGGGEVGWEAESCQQARHMGSHSPLKSSTGESRPSPSLRTKERCPTTPQTKMLPKGLLTCPSDHPPLIGITILRGLENGSQFHLVGGCLLLAHRHKLDYTHSLLAPGPCQREAGFRVRSDRTRNDQASCPAKILQKPQMQTMCGTIHFLVVVTKK